MRNKLMKHLGTRSMTLRQKMLFIMFTVVLLIIVVSLIGFRLVVQTSREILYEQTANYLTVVSDKVSARIDRISEASLHLAVNQEAQQTLSIVNEASTASSESIARADLYRQLSRMYQRDLLTMAFYPKDMQAITLGTIRSPITNDFMEQLTERATDAQGAAIWISGHSEDNSILCVREVRNVNRPFLEQMGFLILRVDLEQIVRESIQDVVSGSYNIVIRQEDEQLYPTQEDDKSPDTVPVLEKRFEIRRWGSEMNFVTEARIHTQADTWHLVFGIPYDSVFDSLSLVNNLFVLSLLLTSLLAIFLAKYMLVSINENVDLLILKMSRVQEGNLEPYEARKPVTTDELGTLNLYFDEMTRTFKELIQENYEKELLLSQTQLKALEQQLNPHFLYNALESIKWFAKRGQGEQVATMAQALGSLLRRTISEDDDSIPLDDELIILDSYLDIQRIRFEDRLIVHQTIDEATRPYLLPKMSIQPLVENAIFYGLEENIGTCTISVEVRLEADELVAEVVNDGSQIDEQILEKLRNKEVSARRHGIGLLNIDSRIKLLYGDSYGLILRNIAGHVLVSFRIPARTRGGTNA